MTVNGMDARNDRHRIRTTLLPLEAQKRLTAAPPIDDIVVTVEEVMTTREIDELYTIYEAAFGPLRILAAARHVLTYAEFVAEVSSPLVSKIIARNRSGRIEGLMTVTNHLETVPWISPDYYRHHYPEHAARLAIYYLGVALVRPISQHSRVLHRMIQRTAHRLVHERAILAFDICRFNDAGSGLAETVAAELRSMADISFDTIDVQSYYAIGFHGSTRTTAHQPAGAVNHTRTG